MQPTSQTKDDPSGTRNEALFKERYRGANCAPGSLDSPVLETLLSRRSVRAYLADPVREKDIAYAVAAAQSAATSSNLQLWNVITVTDPDRKSRLAELSNGQKHIHDAPLLLVWLADVARLRQVAAFEDHPHEGIDYTEIFLTAALDAALAAQSALIAFESMGYGTCYIGSIRSYPLEVAKELDLPPGVFPVFGMTIGREDVARVTAIKPRLAQHAVWFREKYDGTSLDKDIAHYNEVMLAFQAEQKMAPLSWSQKTSRRIEGPAALKNRHKLREYLNEMGFPLK